MRENIDQTKKTVFLQLVKDEIEIYEENLADKTLKALKTMNNKL
jgi:hypothetical protein